MQHSEPIMNLWVTGCFDMQAWRFDILALRHGYLKNDMLRDGLRPALSVSLLLELSH